MRTQRRRSIRFRNRAAGGLNGAMLIVGGRPRLVRAIDYNGESFAWLKALGFNAVRLLAPPTPTQIREAEGKRSAADRATTAEPIAAGIRPGGSRSWPGTWGTRYPRS